MSGFKNFVLRGNLVDLAVAVIIATSFGAVVTTFTQWLTGLMPESASEYFEGCCVSYGKSNYFFDMAFLPHLNCLFNCDFTKWVHGHF